jgi:hypothetical protein
MDSSFLVYFFPQYVNYVLNLTKNGLGDTLGDFFKNSSGHPGCNVARLDVGRNSLMAKCNKGHQKRFNDSFLQLSDIRVYEKGFQAGVTGLVEFRPFGRLFT